MLEIQRMLNSVLNKNKYKTSQIVAMYSRKVSSLQRNLNELIRREKVEDQDMAMILKWPVVVAVVLVLTLLLGGG